MQSQLTHYVKYIVSILLVFLLISCAQDDELLPTISKINKTDYQKKEEIADQIIKKKLDKIPYIADDETRGELIQEIFEQYNHWRCSLQLLYFHLS